MIDFHFVYLPLFSILITYIIISYLNFRKPWTPSKFQLNGYEYLRSHTSKNDKLKSLRIGFRTKCDNDFILKKENLFDIAFKKLGISKEIQTTDKEFDDLLYIISDSKKIEEFTKKDDIRRLLLSLFLDRDLGANIKQIGCSSNMLWVCIEQLSDKKTNDIETITSSVIERIHTLNTKLEEFFQLIKFKRESSFIRYYHIVSLSIAVFVYGFLSFIFHSFFGPYHCDIDKFPPFLLAIKASLTVVLIVTLLAISLLIRTSRAHLILGYLFTFLLVGLTSSIYFTHSYLNASLDNKNPHIYTTTVLKKESVRGKRSTSYYAYITILNGESFKLPISHDFYNSIDINSKVQIEEHDGYYNYHWIGNYKKI